MSENNSFKMGLRDGIPIFLGYLSVSFAFGIFAVGSGLTIIEALLISMTNLTSAGQLAGVPIICSGGSFIELAAAQLIINLRYSLMSVSLSQKLGKSVRLIDRFLISFGNTDEIFAVSVSKRGTLGRKYFYGLILMPYIGWSGGTLLGAVAGNTLPEIVISALGIAIYGMFIAILVPAAKKHRATALCIITAALLGCAFKYIPGLNSISAGFVIIICAVPISLIFAAFAPISAEENDEKEAQENG
ncbi:MAG: AzlC family ABC transporter permease [Clostridia bacterium]|nr:AzlC family ABC transporter permease [Clostridia bacterium]